jgi:homoserine O-acetyltransferase/O-succinyltransferase
MNNPTAVARSAAPPVSAEPAAPVGGIDNVESRTFTIRDFALQCGQALAEAAIAYETYGRLDATGRNAVLLAHGFTSSHHAAGRYAAGKAPRGVFEHEPGWWEALVGPGRAIDTDRLFVVSSNMLGSSYGSTNPASLDPATGKPYGPDFPPITLADIVRAQRLLLEHLGVEHLVAVAGPSFGGYQAFQWAVTFPEFMDGIIAAVTAPKGSGGERAVQDLIAQLAKHPNWNGGFYYHKGGIRTAMIEFRVATLKRYGLEQQLMERYPDPAARESMIRMLAEHWADAFDGNSLITLRRVAAEFDAEQHLSRITAKVLYVLSTTDQLFPAAIGPGVVERLKAAGVDTTYFELESDKGHLASGVDAAKWAGILREFLQRLTAVA